MASPSTPPATCTSAIPVQPHPRSAPLRAIKSVVNAASYIGGRSPWRDGHDLRHGSGTGHRGRRIHGPSTGRLATNIGGVRVLFNGIPLP